MSPSIGVLLVNLGTPAAPTTTAVRKYLAEFLGDPRVIEIPKLLWRPILHGIILRNRPKKSAQLYQKIWLDEGSPLLVYCQRLAAKIQQQVPDNIKIFLAMRYGQPSIQQALENFRQSNLQQLLILPLFPQYSATTTATIFDCVSQYLKSWRNIPEVRWIKNYHHEPDYIQGIVNTIQQQNHEHLLFSFHGLPQRCVDAGDPYFSECNKTVSNINQQLKLDQNNYSLTFQSRFGPAKWLQPYCDVTLQKLAKQGKKNVTVICPGFAVDCLETLEEMVIRNREIFIEAGGESLNYIPALNDSPAQINLMTKLIEKNVQGWD